MLDLTCEHAERYVSSLVTRATGVAAEETETIDAVRERLKTALLDASRTIIKRSEMLEKHFTDKVRKQVADLSLETLGDSSEINELRAEIATLRAELVQLRAQAKTNSKIAV
jgi:polyhydroxyalkanoate synthesis regulator phasin